MTSSVPTPEEQVLFLRNIQRLLAEGQFVATYNDFAHNARKKVANPDAQESEVH